MIRIVLFLVGAVIGRLVIPFLLLFLMGRYYERKSIVRLYS